MNDSDQNAIARQLGRQAERASAPGQGPDRQSTAQFPVKPTTIAVIDDDERLRESVVLLLQRSGYHIVQCGSYRDAVALIGHKDVDLALLDLRLKDGSGLAVLEEARKAGSDTPVIVLSGDTMIESAIGALQLGAQDYLRKPCAPEILLHRVESILSRRKLEQLHRRMALEMEQSEVLHRFLVANSPDIVFILDDESRFSFISDRVNALLGYSSNDLLGINFFALVAEDDIESAESAIRQLRGGESATVELRLKRGQSETNHSYFEMTLTCLQDVPKQWERVGLPSKRGIYGVARDITDKKLAYDRLAFQACHDNLTGLPNRALFVDRLTLATVQARRNRNPMAVIFVDLDRFKLVNDTYGHLKGDEMLKQVAERIKANLRESDTLCRLGGDEFVILLPTIHGRDDAGLVAHKIVEDLVKPFILDGHKIFLSSSLGIALFPDDGEDVETLMRHSDIAMYDVKVKGKNGFTFFSHSMSDVSSRRLTVTNDLRRALEDGQFDLYYQPQVDVQALRITALEALIRWNHPTRGLLTASEFITFAEDLGMMSSLTHWVLDRACTDLKRWWSQGIKLEKMAINFSPRMIEKEDFVEDLMRVLKQHNIPPSSIEVEITENMQICDMEATACKLRILADTGVKIAIDDFGTQYSSLNYLRALPIDTLKIDRSFVMEIREQADDSPIIRAIVAIATGLGMNVVAEGVETELQSNFLKGLGCNHMQGFFYGHPLSTSSLESVLLH